MATSGVAEKLLPSIRLAGVHRTLMKTPPVANSGSLGQNSKAPRAAVPDRDSGRAARRRYKLARNESVIRVGTTETTVRLSAHTEVHLEPASAPERPGF